MKDHGATGVTGCLKNIAYGSFSNVARTHQGGKSYTYSVVGTLACDRAAALAEPCCRSWTGCAPSGTAARLRRTTKYVFYPKQIMFGTDPVAIDRLLLDIIENKRKAEGVLSIWDRSPESLKRTTRERATPIPTSTSSSGSRDTSSTRRRSASASLTRRRSRSRT